MQRRRSERKFIEQLRKCQLRATNQRLAIMRTLMASRSHPSAEDIYQQLKHKHPTLSLSTVYKTLQVMAKIGALLTIETTSGGQRFDGQLRPHHHAVCTRCGEIYDVNFSACLVDLDKRDVLPGFSVQSIKVTFTGTCKMCESINDRFAVPLAAN